MKLFFTFLISSLIFASLSFAVASKNQTIEGSIQGLGLEGPSATIEIGRSGRGTMIRLGSTADLEKLGLTDQILKMGTTVIAVGQVKKGKSQDELVAELIIVNGHTYNLKK